MSAPLRRSPLHALEREQVVPCGLADAFAFFAEAANLESITPPWLRFRIVTPQPVELRQDAIIDYRLRLHRIPLRWRTRIDRWEPGRLFVDVQVAGPFALWEHTHEFAAAAGGTLIHDRVRYRVPAGVLGRAAHRLFVARDLAWIFDYRREAVARLLGA
jgi:ligand-binding SRPBCC domain-containing protein